MISLCLIYMYHIIPILPGFLAHQHHHQIHKHGGQCVVQKAEYVILPHVRDDGEAWIPDGLTHGHFVDILESGLHVIPPGDHVIHIGHIVVDGRRLVSASVGVCVCVCEELIYRCVGPLHPLYSLIPCHIPGAGQERIHAQINGHNVRLVVHVARKDTQHTRSDAHNDATRPIHVVYPASHRFPIAGDHCRMGRGTF